MRSWSSFLSTVNFKARATELLAAVGNTELKPNVASKYLTRYYSEVFLPHGDQLRVPQNGGGPADASWSCTTVLTVMTMLPGARGLRHCRRLRMTVSPRFPFYRHKPSSASRKEAERK